MNNINVVENKISSVRGYLIILENYKKYSSEEISKDITLKGAVERYLYLVTQATIDLAQAFLSFKGFRKPESAAETFEILCERKIIDDNLKISMMRMTGFRNVIAHDYADLDNLIVYDVLQNKIEDIKNFLNLVEQANSN